MSGGYLLRNSRGDAVAKLLIRQVKSSLGAPRKIRRTVEALGLKHQRTVVQPDNPAIRGMLFRVKHLVEVAPFSGAKKSGS